MTRILFFAFLCVFSNPTFVLTRQCLKRTFTKIPVLVHEDNKSEFRIINGCVSWKTLNYTPTKLSKITISGRNITTLKRGAFYNISETFEIIVTNNVIESVEEEAFLNLPGLNNIDLQRNGLNWIETNAFYNLPSLDTLDLGTNHLEMLMQNTFNDLPNLATISLCENRLEYFKQDWFYKTPKLNMIFLYKNKIHSVPRAAFITLPSLEYIDLSDNIIEFVHRKAFENLHKLKEVELEKNMLKVIDIDFQWSPNLAALGFSKNHLTYIPETFLQEIQHSLKIFSINSNPFQCACLDKILKWSMDNNIDVKFLCENKKVVCAIPKGNSSECMERFDEEFYLGFREHFNSDCKPPLTKPHSDEK